MTLGTKRGSIVKRTMLLRPYQAQMRAQFGVEAGACASASRFYMVSRVESHHYARVGLAVYKIPRVLRRDALGDRVDLDLYVLVSVCLRLSNPPHHVSRSAALQSPPPPLRLRSLCSESTVPRRPPHARCCACSFPCAFTSTYTPPHWDWGGRFFVCVAAALAVRCSSPLVATFFRSYGLVRATAQAHLHAIARTSPWVSKALAFHLTDLLHKDMAAGALTHQRFTGAVMTLSALEMFKHGAEALFRLLFAMPRMVAALPADRQEKGQVRMYQLTSILCNTWEWEPMVGMGSGGDAQRRERMDRVQRLITDALAFAGAGAAASAGPDASAGADAAGADAGSGAGAGAGAVDGSDASAKDEEMPPAAEAGAPTTTGTGGSTHWRHHLLSLVCIAVHIRPEVEVSDAAWKWVIKCAVSSVMPVRVLASKLLSSLLGMAVHHDTRVPECTKELLTSEAVLRGLFETTLIDHQYVLVCLYVCLWVVNV